MQRKKKDVYKILVVSDSHGNNRSLNRAVMAEYPFDILIHCGDSEGNLENILDLSDEYEIYAVRGNCDWGSIYPEERMIKVGFYNILVVHGHQHHVKYRNDVILSAGRERYADVVLFGHTHVPEINEKNEYGILLMNPGSIAGSRIRPPQATYGVLTISGDELPKGEIRVLE